MKPLILTCENGDAAAPYLININELESYLEDANACTMSLVKEFTGLLPTQCLKMLKDIPVVLTTTEMTTLLAETYIKEKYRNVIIENVNCCVAFAQSDDEGKPFIGVNLSLLRHSTEQTVINTIVHEMVHVDQMMRGDLEILEDGMMVKWKGKVYNTFPKEGMTAQEKVAAMTETPWEVEAYYKAIDTNSHGEAFAERNAELYQHYFG